MRCITLSGMVAMLLVVCFSPFKAGASQYVQISEPFVNVYEYLDPKSSVVKMVKKGDRLELIYAGTSWYNVKVGSKGGWVERKAGSIIDQPDMVGPIVSIVLIILAVAGVAYGVFYYIQKQKTAVE